MEVDNVGLIELHLGIGESVRLGCTVDCRKVSVQGFTDRTSYPFEIHLQIRKDDHSSRIRTLLLSVLLAVTSKRLLMLNLLQDLLVALLDSLYL